MTIYQQELVELIAEKLDLQEEEVHEQLSRLIEDIHEQTGKGDSYQIEGFGTFYKQEESLVFDPDEALETELNYKYAGMEPVELAESNRDLPEEEEVEDSDSGVQDEPVDEEEIQQEPESVFGMEEGTGGEENAAEEDEAEVEQDQPDDGEQPDDELEDALMDELLEEEEQERQIEDGDVESGEDDMASTEEDRASHDETEKDPFAELEEEEDESEALDDQDEFTGEDMLDSETASDVIGGESGKEHDDASEADRKDKEQDEEMEPELSESSDEEEELSEEEKSIDEMISQVDEDDWTDMDIDDLDEEEEPASEEKEENQEDEPIFEEDGAAAASVSADDATAQQEASQVSDTSDSSNVRQKRTKTTKRRWGRKFRSFIRSVNETFPVVPLLLVSVSVFVLGFGFWMIVSPDLRQNVYEFTDNLISSEQQVEQVRRGATGAGKGEVNSKQTPSSSQQGASGQESSSGVDEKSDTQQEARASKEEQAVNKTKETASRYGLRGDWHDKGSSYTLIIYSFTDRSNATEAIRKVRQNGYRASIQQTRVQGTSYYRVAVGQFKSVEAALKAAENLDSEYRENYFVRRISNS